MAKATGLISSLLNVASARDVPFCQLQPLQCLHHGSIKAHLFLLCAPFLSLLPKFAALTLWLQCETWESVELAGALLMLFIAWKLPKMAGNDM